MGLPEGIKKLQPIMKVAEPEIKHLDGLSSREREVANLVYAGLSNKEIAVKMFITEKTVKYHCTNIFKKHKLKSRAQLIVKMIELRKETFDGEE